MIDAVVDLSHFNADADFGPARSGGVLGVIHKATQGVSFADPAYAARRSSALDAGMLWGAYHFGTGDDPAQQARFFLERVQGDALMALDFEANPGGASMTVAQAGAFVTVIRSETGRWPGIYGGAYLKDVLGGGDPVLANCWLWLAQYESEAVVAPGWNAWSLWQYTDSGVVAGIGACDRSRFNGTAEQLAQFWRLGSTGLRR